MFLFLIVTRMQDLLQLQRRYQFIPASVVFLRRGGASVSAKVLRAINRVRAAGICKKLLDRALRAFPFALAAIHFLRRFLLLPVLLGVILLVVLRVVVAPPLYRAQALDARDLRNDVTHRARNVLR